MNRRNFLQFLGTVAASAALPSAFANATVCRIHNKSSWLPDTVSRFSCAPLTPGRHRFNGMCSEGLCVFTLHAKGGETIIEVPGERYVDAFLGNVTFYPVSDDGKVMRGTCERGVKLIEDCRATAITRRRKGGCADAGKDCGA